MALVGEVLGAVAEGEAVDCVGGASELGVCEGGEEEEGKGAEEELGCHYRLTEDVMESKLNVCSVMLYINQYSRSCVTPVREQASQSHSCYPTNDDD